MKNLKKEIELKMMKVSVLLALQDKDITKEEAIQMLASVALGQAIEGFRDFRQDLKEVFNINGDVTINMEIKTKGENLAYTKVSVNGKEVWSEDNFSTEEEMLKDLQKDSQICNNPKCPIHGTGETIDFSKL